MKVFLIAFLLTFSNFAFSQKNQQKLTDKLKMETLSFMKMEGFEMRDDSAVQKDNPPLAIIKDSTLLIFGAAFGLLNKKDKWKHSKYNARLDYYMEPVIKCSPIIVDVINKKRDTSRMEFEKSNQF